MRIIKTDVLVIGAGAAGLRAAIAAADSKANVTVVTKTLLGKSHTVMAEGGVNAAFGNVDNADDWKAHFKDTMVEGRMLADSRLVEILVKDAPNRVLELEQWGAIFDRTPDGKIDQRFFGAHTYRRTCHTADRIGLEIIRTLEDAVRFRGINVLQEAIVTKIFTEKNRVCGATAVDMKSGEFFAIECKSIILATGGAGRVYKISTNSLEAVGDGLSLALEAGCELQDMEMVQFHPTAMVYPESVRGLLVTEAVRGEGGILLNSKGERFMKNYDPKRMELGARDVVARAIYKEVEEGRGTENGGVWLDVRHIKVHRIMKKLPRMFDQFITYAGIDITKEKVEVAPASHYTMGGIRILPGCSTRVEGIFAAGECAGGVHGANRLGGNSLAETIVFGKIAGETAAAYAANSKHESLDELVEEEFSRIKNLLSDKNEFLHLSLKRKIQEAMWEHAGIIRDGEKLKNALQEIKDIRGQLQEITVAGSLKYNYGLFTLLEANHMTNVCECIVASALARKESRGAHYRLDYPQEDNKLVNIVCSLEKELKISTYDVKEPRTELKKILEA